MGLSKYYYIIYTLSINLSHTLFMDHKGRPIPIFEVIAFNTDAGIEVNLRADVETPTKKSCNPSTAPLTPFLNGLSNKL